MINLSQLIVMFIKILNVITGVNLCAKAYITFLVNQE